MPDGERFKDHMTAAIENVCRGRTDCTIRAYGEMVDLLWKDGHTVAAVRLEMLWNKLAMTHDFSLLCGYAMGNFYKDASINEICQQHTHVIGAGGEVGAFRPETGRRELIGSRRRRISGALGSARRILSGFAGVVRTAGSIGPQRSAGCRRWT